VTDREFAPKCKERERERERRCLCRGDVDGAAGRTSTDFKEGLRWDWKAEGRRGDDGKASAFIGLPEAESHVTRKAHKTKLLGKIKGDPEG
jgi:hypothetical protein